MIILIIDDLTEKAKEIASAIHAIDCRISIEHSTNSKEAKDKLRQKKYDLVILDLALPKFLNQNPSKEVGYGLLTEILDSGLLIKPRSILCLTEFKEILQDYKDIISEELVTVHEFSYSNNRWKNALKKEIERQQQNDDFVTPKKHKTDFLVICALKKPELDNILKLDFNWDEPKLINETSIVYKGSIATPSKDFSIVATSQNRMGSVNSAITTTKLINEYLPRYVVMTGICAGDKSSTNMGDLILVSPSWNWEAGKWVEENNGTIIFKQDPHQINISSKISSLFEILSTKRQRFFDIHEHYNGNKPANIPALLIGPVACGSSVIANSKMYDDIKEQNRKLLGVEMESYGLYSACDSVHELKPLFFCIKSVCDFADNEKNDNFQDYSSYVSAKALEELIMQFHHTL